MIYAIIILLLAMAVTRLAVPLASLLSRRLGAWDHPDELGIHRTSTPRSGGIAMALGLLIGLQLVWWQNLEAFSNRLVVATVVGSTLVFIIGLLDDLHEIKPLAKALGLVAAALLGQLIAPHASISGFERLDFILGVVVLLLGANAVNLMDGMDGLASGLVAISCLGFASVSAIMGRPLFLMQAIVVAGVALGFWLANRPRARIFMGDCGSLMLGYILAGMALKTASFGRTHILISLAMVSPFLLDTGLAIVRRLANRQNILDGDRKHIYDILYLRLGSVWRVLGLMYLMSLVFVGLGTAMIYIPWHYGVLMLLVLWTAVVVAMVRLGMFSGNKTSKISMADPSGL